MHCAAVWQHSSNSNIKIVHNSIEHFLRNPSDFSSDEVLSCLVCWLFSQTLFFRYPPPPQKIVRWVEILGIGWPGVFGLTRNESVPWEVMPEVFKCPVREKSVSWGIYGTKYSRLSKFCGRQPLKNFRGYGLLISLESF